MGVTSPSPSQTEKVIVFNNSLPFLDVLVLRGSDSFTTTICRKPFSVSLPPHNKSCHPPNQKIAAFNSFVFRALNICSNKILLEKEINYIKAIAIDRGYSTKVIDHIIRKFSKPRKAKKHTDSKNTILLPFFPKISHQIANILKKFKFVTIFYPTNKIRFSYIKDPIETKNNWGIYEISCQCSLKYIGQTKRALKYRINEHKNYVKKEELVKSSIATHCWSNDHVFNFSSPKIIQKCSNIYHLDFLETYHILKNKHKLVNDLTATPFLSPVWKNLIDPPADRGQSTTSPGGSTDS